MSINITEYEIFQNFNSTGISVIYIEKSNMFKKKFWMVLKYLLHLHKFYTVTLFSDLVKETE